MIGKKDTARLNTIIERCELLNKEFGDGSFIVKDKCYQRIGADLYVPYNLINETLTKEEVYRK